MQRKNSNTTRPKSKRRVIETNILPFPMPILSRRSLLDNLPKETCNYIDLASYLRAYHESTVLVRITDGSDIRSHGIGGDLLITDCSLHPQHGDLIAALVDGELLLRKLSVQRGKYLLVSATQNYCEPLEADEAHALAVVRHGVYRLRAELERSAE